VDGLEYSWIPDGTFSMGCVPTDPECEADERPAHTVRLTRGFWLGRTEVTVGAFERFVSATGVTTTAEEVGRGFTWIGDRWVERAGVSWRHPGFAQGKDHPVVAVSWGDASAYCRWAGGRLPSEAEWERAARAGRDGAVYAWGAREDLGLGGRPQANVADLSAGRAFAWDVFDVDDGYVYTAPVATFTPNGFGLYDMSGNAYEWVADWYRSDFYSRSPPSDPQGPADGRFRGLRGGSWSYYPSRTRLSARGSQRPDDAKANVGFRCAIAGS
jgi:formylglycine-generating enzyme required for sulfatase activity